MQAGATCCSAKLPQGSGRWFAARATRSAWPKPSRALEVKTTLDGHTVDVRSSVGVAVCPDHGHDPAKLLQRAEVAMRAAKKDQLRIVMWDDRYDENGEKRLALMSDLKKAVDNEELALIYQPRVPLGENGEHYVEALVRWQHPTRGLVPPSEFVPLAEPPSASRRVSRRKDAPRSGSRSQSPRTRSSASRVTRSRVSSA